MTRQTVMILLGLMAVAAITIGAENNPPPENVTLTARMPVLDTVTGYPWEQTKDGVTIKLVPVPFEAKAVYRKTVKEKPKGLFSISTGNTEKYLITDEPMGYIFKPDSLTFQLHITNHMTHVLRFAGCVLSFVADGKSLPINTRTQDDLLKAIILPQGSLDLTLMGPQVCPDHVGDTTKALLDTAKTIMFSFYDVTTEVDAANNTTKKATFEWIFAINPAAVSGTFEKTVVEEKLMPSEAAKENNQWYLK